MADDHVVSIARDFSRFPGPRFRSQGKHSGEEFRDFLVSLLARYDEVTIDMDGTTGIGSSFIDEAIGGLISKAGLSRDDVRCRVHVTSRLDASYLVEVKDSIERAQPR